MDRYDYLSPATPGGNAHGSHGYRVMDRARARQVANCEDGDDARLIVRLLNAHDAAMNEQARDNVEGHPA